MVHHALVISQAFYFCGTLEKQSGYVSSQHSDLGGKGKELTVWESLVQIVVLLKCVFNVATRSNVERPIDQLRIVLSRSVPSALTISKVL